MRRFLGCVTAGSDTDHFLPSRRTAMTFCMAKCWHAKRMSYGSYAAAVVAAPFRNVSRSALIVSASVVGMPCGKPL